MPQLLLVVGVLRIWGDKSRSGEKKEIDQRRGEDKLRSTLADVGNDYS